MVLEVRNIRWERVVRAPSPASCPLAARAGAAHPPPWRSGRLGRSCPRCLAGRARRLGGRFGLVEDVTEHFCDLFEPAVAVAAGRRSSRALLHVGLKGCSDSFEEGGRRSPSRGWFARTLFESGRRVCRLVPGAERVSLVPGKALALNRWKYRSRG